MRRTIATRMRLRALLGLSMLLGATALPAAPGEGDKARAPLYLVSGPVTMEAGGTIRAAVVNLGRSTMHVEVAFIGPAGVYEREQEAEIVAGHVGVVEYSPSADFLGVVQITFSARPATGAWRAALIGAGGAGTYLLYRYSTDDSATMPIAN
jgi:hypothetical protein